MSQKAIRGVGWFFLNRVSTRIFRLVNRLVVAKLLVPVDFGLAVLAITIVGVADTIRTMGFDDAIIARREDDIDIASNTAFWLLTCVGILLMLVVILLAPLLGDIFREGRLTPVLQLLAVVLAIDSLETVPAVLLQKNLEFKKKLLPGILPPAIYTIVSIGLAATGFGVWSLVFGQIGSSVVSVTANWGVAKYVPRFDFDMTIARELAGFGSNIVVAAVSSMIYQRLDDLVIGWILGPAALAAYTIGYMLGNLPTIAITKTVTPVLYPTISKIREDDRKSIWATTVRIIGLLSLPAGIGLIVVAPELIATTLGSKYQNAVPILQIVSIYGVIRSLSSTGGPVLKSSGLVQLYSRLMIIHAVLLSLIIWPMTEAFGTVGAAGAIVLSSVPNNLGQFYYAAREVGQPISDLGISLLSYVAYAVVMGIGVLAVDAVLSGPPIVTLVLLVGTGIVIYAVQILVLEYRFVIFCFRVVTEAVGKG